ncbi:uncharacterized protein LOC115678095 [Syzygium oleosum]|uniref:uncharacterized protein LOC115678095 n=1 Tax=Syzygium oleosum TaxID=219896 RepID=UPI0024BB899B|nr:uncharacterized protein LOC115678095 [Syzygium oleosum]
MAMSTFRTLEAPASAEIPEDAEVGHESAEEIERLESDVSRMAEKILHYRTALPDQLKQALELLKSAERFDFAGSRPGTSGDSDQGAGEMSVAVERHAEISKKVQLLKEKTAANASMVPILLKRMKDCISSIDNLSTQEHSTIRIHSTFNRKESSNS